MPSPEQILRQARPGKGVIGWSLDRAQRAALLEQFPPAYVQVVADHVTLAARVSAATPLPDPVEAEAVGQVDDGSGVQALVVAIGGGTGRPDGSTYHITWSLAHGRRAKESNDVLAARAWQPLARPIPLRLNPARWP
jgi:hypothetical protein